MFETVTQTRMWAPFLAFGNVIYLLFLFSLQLLLGGLFIFFSNCNIHKVDHKKNVDDI